MLGRHAGLEGHAVRLRRRVAVAMLDEEQSLAFGEGGAQVGRFADQPGLALLADAALEHRFDEDELVPIDKVLDLSLGRGGTEDLGDRKIDMPQQRRAVKKAGEFHLDSFLRIASAAGREGVAVVLSQQKLPCHFITKIAELATGCVDCPKLRFPG